MVYKEYKMGSYNLHTIKTDKFKLCHVEVIFRNNVVKEEINKRNMVFDILCECNKTYPSKRDLYLQMEDLYNASIYSVTSKTGNAIISNVCLDFINPIYTEKKVLDGSIKLLFDLLHNPLANNNEFDSKVFELIKNRMKDTIKSIKENPKKYALLEALKTLGDKTTSSYGNIGTLKDLEDITPENLYEHYEKILKSDYIDIYVVGDLDMDNVLTIIDKYAKFTFLKNSEFKLYVDNPKRKTIITTDHYNYAQTNIVVILNLNKLDDYEKKYVANIYNIILGGGSLETKLYRRLRGENSLCYNVKSVYQKYDGFILINTAVDINANKKALKLIRMALKDMANNITDDELNQAKELVTTSINMNKDNIGKIVDNYFFKDISDLDDFEERIKTFASIKKEDIYKLSKKISILAIYTLVGNKNE